MVSRCGNTATHHKKGDKRKCTIYRGISSSVPRVRSMPSAKVTEISVAFVLAEARWTRSLPFSISLRNRENMRKRSMHVLLILKKHMIAFLEASSGRCCYNMTVFVNRGLTEPLLFDGAVSEVRWKFLRILTLSWAYPGGRWPLDFGEELDVGRGDDLIFLFFT